MIRLALLLALLPSLAWGACYDRAILAAFLREAHGLRLHSWGLTDAGDMQELFIGPTGHWAVVQTKPNACSEVVSLPHKEKGRLTGRPLLNKAQPPRGLYPGEPG